MKVKQRRVQFLVTVTMETPEGVDFDGQVDEIEARIREQVAGHRTPKRLAVECEVSFSRTVWEDEFEVNV